jgi:hypothetical protein
VLQQAVDAACASLGAPSFEVTPTQVMAFKKFRFAGASYTDIGDGLLPFSITPADAISPQARSMLAADHVRADAFDLGGDPESGAITPGEVSTLRNLSGYVPISWMDARSQLHSTAGLVGALMGTSHPALVAYGRFLRQYDHLFTRLESEIDQVYGWRLSLIWLPTVTSIPALSALRSTARPPAAAPLARTPVQVQALIRGLATEAAASPRRDPGCHVRNPSRQACFVGNTPLGRTIRSKAIASAIADAGAPPTHGSSSRCYRPSLCLVACQGAMLRKLSPSG